MSLTDQWLASLDPHLQEILLLAAGSLEDFSSNVRAADALALLAFRRAFDSEGLDEHEAIKRMEMARKALATAAALKAQRLDMLDKYENIADSPRPANLEYVVIQQSRAQAIERLRALGYEKEADELAESE